MAERVVDALEAVEIDEQNGQLFAARQRLLHLLAEQQPVRQIGERVMARHVHDLRFGLAAFGDVLVGRDPAAVGGGVVGAGHHAAVAEFVEMRAVGGAAHEVGQLRQQFVHGLAGVILPRHAQFEDFAERDAGLDLVALQPEDFEEAPVDDLEPVLRVEQAQALRHVVERGIEPPDWSGAGWLPVFSTG